VKDSKNYCVKSDGLIETAEGVEGILLRMEWAKRAYVVLDGCSEAVILRKCPLRD